MNRPQNITLEYCNHSINKEWDYYLSTIPEVSFEQASVWGQTSTLKGWSPHRLILKKDNKIVGGVQILIIKFSILGAFGYVQQGPVATHLNDEETNYLISELKKFAKSNQLHYLTIDVSYNKPSLTSKLTQKGFIKHHNNLPPTAIISSTLLIDLTQDLNTIFASFKSERRKSIRAGEKHNITFRQGNRNDITLLFNLINQTCERRKIKSFYPNPDLFYSIWDNFSPNNWVDLTIAEIDNKPVCASLSLTFGDTFRDTYWGWSGEFQHLYISDLITWKMISRAKEMGFKHYDLVHLDTPSAKAILSGNDIPFEIKSRPYFGTTFYKMRFGGKVLFYPGSYSYFPSKFKQKGLALLSNHLLGNSKILYIIKQIRLLKSKIA